MSFFSASIKLSSLNGHLICGLCGGYLIDATVLTECVHVFCRSCILKYLAKHKVCPLCQSLIQETRPGQALQPDVALQRIVYKLVPGLLRTEMKRLTDFCASISDSDIITKNDGKLSSQSFNTTQSDFCHPPLPTALATRSLSKSPSALPSSQMSWKTSTHNRLPSSFAFLVDEQDFLSVSLAHLEDMTSRQSLEINPITETVCTTVSVNSSRESKVNQKLPHFFPVSSQIDDKEQSEIIHLLCPSAVTVGTLHHLLLAKYQLDPGRKIVDVYLDGECLEPSHSLREVAFLYAFPARQQRMRLGFVFGDACLAWWGRPMPHLERPSQKEQQPPQNGWTDLHNWQKSLSPEPVTVDPVRGPHLRARSSSSDTRSNEQQQQKPKRTSL